MKPKTVSCNPCCNGNLLQEKVYEQEGAPRCNPCCNGNLLQVNLPKLKSKTML